MTARFILSLDCEGKWGVADILTPEFHCGLTDQKLKSAYGEIVDALDEFAIPATFAFVGAFAQPSAKFAEIGDGLRLMAASAPDYLGPALADINHGSRQGWHGEGAVDRVASARTNHEIALHGMTHVPWSDVDDDFIDAELALWKSMSGPVRDAQTFVYPRNAIAHIDQLSGAGILGYRKARPPISRLGSLLSEFNIWADADPDIADVEGIVPVPAGYFINWLHGPRRLVPRAMSARRAAHVLSTAKRDNAVAHYWIHPENMASAPATIFVLRDLLKLVAEWRERGDCVVLTQAQYCAERKSGTGRSTAP